MAGFALRQLFIQSSRLIVPSRPLPVIFQKKQFIVNPILSALASSSKMSSTISVVQPVEEAKEDAKDPNSGTEAVLKSESNSTPASDSKTDSSSKTESEEKTGGSSSAAIPKPFQRIRKRKIVLMLSYCGQEYYGMQRNPDTKTIEEELFKSLLKNNYMDEEAFKKPQTINFQRAARTDKHVSAARQIVSFKGDENLDFNKLNDYLPPEIRVMGMKRVTQGFDCKNNCDARTYMYMTPTFAFTPVDVPTTEAYRISPERIQEIQSALDLYLGNKNFHNFTSRKRPHDPSAMRRIYSFTCSEPFIKDGLEYVILRVKGQSFMLHQIRKMIGLVMAYMRGFASLDTFNKCWTADRIDIPKAPGVGLMLDYVHYQRYDTKFGSDGMHDPITWESVEGQVQAFCDEFIYPVITKAENVDKSMLTWLGTLSYHTYDVRDEVANELYRTSSEFSKIGKAYLTVCHVQGKDPLLSSDELAKFRKGEDSNSLDQDDAEGENDAGESIAKKAKLAEN